MTMSLASRNPGPPRPTPSIGPSLADVLPRVRHLNGASGRARQNMASSIRTFCRVLDRRPELVPVSAPAFRSIVRSAHPAALGVGPTRWRNVVSDVRRAIRLSGLGGRLGISDALLTEEWRLLVSRLTDQWKRSAVKRFGQFCSACQVAPRDVDDAALQRYREYLEETQLHRDPVRSVACLTRAWNRCAERDAVWPGISLTVPNRSRRYALEWSDLPASLLADVQAFHVRSLNPDPFNAEAGCPVRPSTIAHRDGLIRRLAAALVAQGVPKDDLHTLADLVRPDRLKQGLRFFLERAGHQTSSQVEAVANLALVVARRWSRLSPDQVREIEIICRRLRRPRRGLTEKNRTRLRQFAEDRSVHNLLNLPARLVAKAKRGTLSRKVALMVQTALAIELLIFAPIRIGNLVRLDRNRNFVWARSAGQRALHLVIPAVEVKNEVDLEYPLPQETVALLDLYTSTYQPVLTRGNPSSLLFPGQGQGPKRPNGFCLQISSTIKRETGLEMNPHLFRHLGALLHLESHPGEYEVVRRVLGHKSINTTLQNYAGLEIAAAVRHFDQTILARRSETTSMRNGGKRSR